jgi:hypothetical protein
MSGGIPVRPCEVNEEGDQFGSASATGDFNGDGFVDLAMGAPGKAPGGDPRSGAVFIFPGSVKGNGITTGFFITQTHAGVVNEEGDQFGAAVAVGDFNGDGIEDLAVGAPGKAPAAGGPRSGAVFIFPGSVNGLTCLPGVPCPTTIITGYVITQADIGGVNGAGDEFGAALTVADFNGDGIEDLAVGAPGKAPAAGGPRSGAVFIYPGSKKVRLGLTQGSVMITQTNAAGSENCNPAVTGSCIPGVNEEGDRFGAALASGDLVGDVYEELIVGAPGKQLASGAVFVFPASAKGLITGFYITQADATGSAFCNPAVAGSCIPGVNEAGDQFGAALAVGDIDGDQLWDLVVGAPGDAPGGPGRPKSGSVFIFPGAETSIIPGVYLTHADMFEPLDVLPNEEGDRFGASLAFGEFTGDLFDELLVGAPGKATGPAEPKSGTVCIFPGSITGIQKGVFISETGRGGAQEAGDQFGASLVVADFNGDHLEDAIVGAPGEAFGADPKSGAAFTASWGDINYLLTQ